MTSVEPATPTNESQIHRTASLSKNKGAWVSPFRAGTNAKTVSSPKIKQKEPKESKPSIEVDDNEEPLEPQTSEPAADDNEDEELLEEQTDAVDAEEAALETEHEEPVGADETALENEHEEVLNEEASLKEGTVVKSNPLVIPADIRSKPKLSTRYAENWSLTASALNKNKVVNTGRRVNLGAGLILTEEQIYELARKKLEPLMSQIDKGVADKVHADEVRAAKVEDDIRIKDEAVVASELAAYKAIVDEKSEVIKSKHEKDMKDLKEKIEKSEADTKLYIETQKTAIETDQTDAEEAEKKAAEEHITNKENLLKNAEELKELKSKTLEETKAKQIEETEKAENFQKEGEELSTSADKLEADVASKKAELEEKINRIEALISEKLEKKNALRSTIKSRKIADRSFGIIAAQHNLHSSNANILRNHVGLLNERVAAHETKINHFNTEGKEALAAKKSEAGKAKNDWDNELQEIRLEEARKQERIRIEAEEERKRVEEEKLAEEARIQKEKEEEEARLAQKKEEERLAEEKRKKEEEERMTLEAAEVERMKKAKELSEAKEKLEKELEAQHKAEQIAIQKRVAAEEKMNTEKKSSSKKTAAAGLAAAAVGSVIAGGAVAAATIGGAASNAANSGISAAGSAINHGSDSLPSESASAPISKSADFTKSDDVDDLPSTIDEEPEHDGTGKKDLSESEDCEAKAEPTAAAVAPRRTSMVDEAISSMTPDQIKKMNTPLKDLYPKTAESKSRSASISRSNSLGKSKSRSNSLSFSFKKNKSKNGSLKMTASEARAAAVATKKANAEKKAASIASVSKKTPEPTSATPAKETVIPVKTSGSIKKNGETKSEEPNVADDDSLDDDSDLEAANSKPVFTESIVPPTAESDAKDNGDDDDDDDDDAYTLETVDTKEYEAHKDDPNYMVISS